MNFQFTNPILSCVRGDITQMKTDAIVNAANTSLLGGSGVDGAIHRAAGPELLHECRLIGGCKTGQAVITTGGKLPAKRVIHTVGPVWRAETADRAAQLLTDCYFNVLSLALENNLKTIAFPNISTGVYHFPKFDASLVALRAVREFLAVYPDAFEQIIFVCYEADNYELYQMALEPLAFIPALRAEIERVFNGAPPPKVNWKQATLRDDYISGGPEWEKAGASGWKGRWQNIPDAYFSERTYQSEFNFLDPDGVLFYYPACMVRHLRAVERGSGQLHEGLWFAAQRPDDRFALFTPEQKSAVQRFWTWVTLSQDDGLLTKF